MGFLEDGAFAGFEGSYLTGFGCRHVDGAVVGGRPDAGGPDRDDGADGRLVEAAGLEELHVAVAEDHQGPVGAAHPEVRADDGECGDACGGGRYAHAACGHVLEELTF